MVALLRHFLAGSLLLLAVFTPTVDAKAVCTEGGICLGKKQVDILSYPYAKNFKPIKCADKCYNFFCLNKGGLHIGAGCKEAVEKHCPGNADKILNGKYNKMDWIEGEGFYVNECIDDDYCEILSAKALQDHVDTVRMRKGYLYDKATVETCEYNEVEATSPFPSHSPNADHLENNAGISFGTSMTLLGDAVIGWILAVCLW